MRSRTTSLGPANQQQLDSEVEQVTQQAENLAPEFKYGQLKIGACDGIIFIPLFQTEKHLRDALQSMYIECKARIQ
jgi:hypothetical protein